MVLLALLLLAAVDRSLRLWTVATGELRASWEAPPGDASEATGINQVDYSADGKLLAASWGGHLVFLDAATLAKVERKNGVFTYALLSGLSDARADANKDGVIRVSELRDHVFAPVQELTLGQQKPTARREQPGVDFPVF